VLGITDLKGCHAEVGVTFLPWDIWGGRQGGGGAGRSNLLTRGGKKMG